MSISEPYLFKEKSQGEKGKAITEKNLPRHRPNDLEKIPARPDRLPQLAEAFTPLPIRNQRRALRNCDLRRGVFSLWPTCSVCSMHTYYCLDFFRSEVFLGFEMPSDTEPCAHLVYVGLPFFSISPGKRPRPWLYWGSLGGYAAYRCPPTLFQFGDSGFLLSSYTCTQLTSFSYHVFGY